MGQRINYPQQLPELTGKLIELGQLVRNSGLEASLLDLVNIRASQLNGCGFCLDMHVKEAKIRGERELRDFANHLRDLNLTSSVCFQKFQ